MSTIGSLPRQSNGRLVRQLRRANATVLPTLLDRLCHDAPRRINETSSECAPTRARMREILLRDLGYLLSTTSLEDQIDRARFPEAAASTVNFGIPPLCGTCLATRRWSDIERVIRRAILEFEPRVLPASLAVLPISQASTGIAYNLLMFEVSGVMNMKPYPLDFLLSSSLDLETSRMQVVNARTAKHRQPAATRR
ncbi:type VI secretion system baseplate subunit TssE [Paraburkholderia sp. BCC1886]|uniref:type VI secretion system baseplate subunit TssE n=1 Tax=Paraburkholderia sp. BCC1886 TaxID=2562670 RepID=UPI0011843091|nr:GPW/gp25 family protein [Paraburkholderia sp. BCC1886]